MDRNFAADLARLSPGTSKALSGRVRNHDATRTISFVSQGLKVIKRKLQRVTVFRLRFVDAFSIDRHGHQPIWIYLNIFSKQRPVEDYS
ncbi:hypothetical protein [Mesorhizobium sp. INR15]|uniref:hypothetical protein n=1 Tax=Mesorhizobium sp. INR15 TaxID=2654248 RepID=UPI001896409C|nr:hypothetical protein [Mesorhizobium sp. INR15]QPC93120.1 hypothetical protein GA829_22525 [Mesorhizobium sp. INR15]